jgi:hypothetical protein
MVDYDMYIPNTQNSEIEILKIQKIKEADREQID